MARRKALWAQARARRGQAGLPASRIEVGAFDPGAGGPVAMRQGARAFAWQGKRPDQVLFSAAVLLGAAALGVVAGAAAAVWGW